MEELLQHCMRELAFDGDLGCDVARLQHFIQGYYASQRPPRTQNVDNAFHTFVWTLLVQQSSVCVGLVPQDAAIEVYIAPQLSKKKAVSKPKKKLSVPEPAPFPALNTRNTSPGNTNSEPFIGRLLPIPDATTRPLENLMMEYGNSLRVAVDPETSFVAITGSHTRPAKLSPMVYTALQLISRGREAGLSVIDLGKKTGYDQKTCFYLIQQLLALDLVVKLGKGGAGGGNFCIHKYFYERSPFWEGVRREEHLSQGNQHEKKFTGYEATGLDGPKLEVQFDPIDSRHLISAQLIKSRVVKLLKSSENGLHIYQNLIMAVGFAKPTKRDRRFFTIRIRELIEEKIIEKVTVPKVQGTTRALCIRLVDDSRTDDTDGIVVQSKDVEDEEQGEAQEDNDQSLSVMPLMNMTIHRQIVMLLEQADSKGLTLNNISSRLGMFDKRTIELLLYRLERYPPPPHLADLATCDFIENHGRERRHRYYTLTGYLCFIRDERIDNVGLPTRYTVIDVSQSGGFYLQRPDLFYNDYAALITFEDEYRNRMNPSKEGAEGTSTKKIIVRDKIHVTNPTPTPRGKRSLPGARSQTEETTQSTARKPILKGIKRKQVHDAEQDPSDLQPQSKKQKRVEPVNIASPLVDAMDVDEDQNLQPAEKQSSSEFNVDRPGYIYSSGTGPREHIELIANTTEVPSDQVTLGPLLIAAQDEMNIPTNVLHPTAVFDTPTNVKFVTATEPKTWLASSTQGMSPDLSCTSNAAVSTHDPTGGTKRGPDTPYDVSSPGDGYPVKRPKTGRPKRAYELVNISQLRAENEIMRVVDESGGIANVSSKEFLETYTRVVTSMVEAGEPTSMPVGSQPDRRTIRKILDRLVDRGKLKMLTATITPRITQPRIANLIYEPAVAQEKLDQYLLSLREDLPTPSVPVHRKLNQPVHYTRPKRHSIRGTSLLQDNVLKSGEQDTWRAENGTFSDNEDDIQSMFTCEAQTVAQLYGYLVGRVRRARELHQFTLTQLQDPEPSSYIVSQSERIVAFPYYFHDLPVSTYFAIVSATGYSQELSNLMESSEGCQTFIKDLPLNLSDQLKIGRARDRAKIADLLELLAGLKLVTPLQSSNNATPYLSCEPNGTHPTCFDIALMAKDRNTVALTPSYWRFNLIAPIYLYSQAASWPPPFHRDIFVRTADESMPFWFELEDASLNKEVLVPMTSMDSITGPCTCPLSVARTLRRRHSWTSSYVLSLRQRQYLRQKWTNPLTSYTPLSDPDGGRSRLEHLCNLISAPFDAVYNFFTTIHNLFTNESARIQERDQQRGKGQRERQAHDRALLAKKAAEARHQLEVDWDSLVSQVHSAPLPHGSVTMLKEIRMRYLQSRAKLTTQQWESAILEAISGSKSSKRNPVLPTFASSPRKPYIRTGISKPLPVASDQQKSVKELIERYKDKVPVDTPVPKKKKKKSKTTNGKEHLVTETTVLAEPSRRQRFQWTPEYDELARDASAIIRARCRTWYRMDWTALDQLFPFLPRNNVRQRLTTLKQEPGGESYLHLLEEKWHELWSDHHGTEALPDNNPEHPSEFDAIAHVEFLRQYVDKRALRVGLSKVNLPHSTGAILTEDTSDFISKWNLKECARPTNKLDFLWSSIGDEHREKTLLGEAFSTMINISVVASTIPLSNGVAESALKMTLATPEEEYDASDAALLLNNVGQHAVRQASEELLARGVISESGHNRRKRPGRKLLISDLNEEALGGSFRPEFCVEASMKEDAIEDSPGHWTDWSLVATGGDMAALIELVSEGKLDFQVDITESTTHRQELDWNSKKVDDDQIETALRICCGTPTVDPGESPESPLESSVIVAPNLHVERTDSGSHGFNCEAIAACRKSSTGLITCSACIDADLNGFLSRLGPQERSCCLAFIEQLDGAGLQGLNYEMLSADSLASCDMQGVIQSFISAKPSLCHWVGYNYPVLVSRRHLGHWSISIPGPAPRLIFPRRWLNIKGERMHDVWNAGLRAVVGVLILRPGIPQSELRQRLLSVYDRQELNDLLQYLLAEDIILKEVAPEDKHLAYKDVQEIGGAQEQKVYWSLNTSTWYRVDE
ncbi:hypothetical protein K439DRAFT_1332462 [Ramaria rubella]|nr:hypothetical protein K439DRAFT_1332462 [Ramaria rubella]